MANLLIDAMRQNRKLGRLSIHEFVIMPNHFHLLITPAEEVSLEKALQFIKGGFSYRVKKELDLNFEIWEPGFTNHRIRDARDYSQHREYIHENPVEEKLVERAEMFPYSSAYPGMDVDPAPPWLKPKK
jgi:putative transposase